MVKYEVKINKLEGRLEVRERESTKSIILSMDKVCKIVRAIVEGKINSAFRELVDIRRNLNS